MTLGKTKFETVLQVRPDDIDMNQHVHSSRYQDYVLAARYDQMARCYKMSMEEFFKAGLGWFVKAAHLEYKRPLGLGDFFIVRTWVEELFKDGVLVRVGQRFRTTHEFAYTALDILYTYPENSGMYQAFATNLHGTEASTKTKISCKGMYNDKSNS